jgi:hypothetical protein
MKRFFFDEEDDDNEEDMMNEAEKMLPEFVPEFFAIPQQEDPAIHVLNYAVRICEQNFMWRFLGNVKKITMIKSVFNDLMMLMEGVNSESDDPEMDGKEKG